MLENLEILYVHNDKEFDLAKNLSTLSRLPKLKELHLEGDHFKQIPSEINSLRALEYLYLNNNEIQQIPKEVFQMKQIKLIDVSNNRMSHIMLERYKDNLEPTVSIIF